MGVQVLFTRKWVSRFFLINANLLGLRKVGKQWVSCSFAFFLNANLPLLRLGLRKVGK